MWECACNERGRRGKRAKSEGSSKQRARAALSEHHRIQGDWHDGADWGAVISRREERSDVTSEVIDPRRQSVRVQGHRKATMEEGA